MNVFRVEGILLMVDTDCDCDFNKYHLELHSGSPRDGPPDEYGDIHAMEGKRVMITVTTLE